VVIEWGFVLYALLQFGRDFFVYGVVIFFYFTAFEMVRRGMVPLESVILALGLVEVVRFACNIHYTRADYHALWGKEKAEC